MKTTWSQFYEAVVDAELHPKACPASGCDHWQITGGAKLVNVWPNTKRGCRIAVDNGRGRSGTVAKAIALAGPPKLQAEKKYPPSVPDKFPAGTSANAPFGPDKPRVGLIRWFWRLVVRWIW